MCLFFGRHDLAFRAKLSPVDAGNISDLAGGSDICLLDLLEKLKAVSRCKSRMSPQTIGRCYGFFADVVEHFAFLWEASASSPLWGEVGHLHLGVLRGLGGKARKLTGGYKRSLVVEARNATGQGIRTARQILVGLTVATRRTPSVRLGLRQRQALKRRSAATSQPAPSGGHAKPTTAYTCETFEQFSYFYDCRTT